MFNKTYTVVADNFKGERVTETIEGSYFFLCTRLSAIRKHGFHVQSVTKH